MSNKVTSIEKKIREGEVKQPSTVESIIAQIQQKQQIQAALNSQILASPAYQETLKLQGAIDTLVALLKEIDPENPVFPENSATKEE